MGSSLCSNISFSAVGCFVTFVPGKKREERGGEVEEKVSRDNKSLTKQVVKIIIISI